MSAPTTPQRAALVNGVIMVALCVGGYMMLVDGPRQRATDARVEAEAIAEQLKDADSQREDVPRLTSVREKIRSESARLADQGRLARDDRELYSTVMALADTSGVMVEQLLPAKLPPKPPVPLGQAGPPDARDGQAAYNIAAVGTYAQVAEFIRGLRTTMGHTLVRSVRMTPTMDEESQIVRAVIETEHYAFDATPSAGGP